jgi:hypothetical protein
MNDPIRVIIPNTDKFFEELRDCTNRYIAKVNAENFTKYPEEEQLIRLVDEMQYITEQAVAEALLKTGYTTKKNPWWKFWKK